MSAKPAWTPGPWVDGQPMVWGGALWCIYAGKNGNKILATASDPYGHDGAVAKANALLIAAAPELYAALREAPCPRPANRRPDDETVGTCHDSGNCGCIYGAALAKADGP